MLWNWQLIDWPKFVLNDLLYLEKENLFMRICGQTLASLSLIQLVFNFYYLAQITKDKQFK